VAAESRAARLEAGLHVRAGAVFATVGRRPLEDGNVRARFKVLAMEALIRERESEPVKNRH
jgi:hypothetical protein